jgi:hypothetical protein
MYTMIYNTNWKFLKILTISFIGGGNYQLTEKLLNKPELLLSEIFSVKLLTPSNFYISGTRTSYSNCMTVTPGSAGFIFNS